MSTFPFLSVPLLPRNVILKNLDLEDLLVLSTCSLKAYRAVKILGVSVKNVDLSLDDDSRSSIRIGTFQFWTRTGTQLRFTFDNAETIIEHYKWKYQKVPNPLKWAEFAFGGVKRAEPCAMHFMNLLKKVDKIRISLRSGNIQNFFLWKITKNIERLEITAGKVSVSEMNFMLEELNVKYLMFDPIYDVTYEKGLKHEKITILNAYWLDLNAILSSECREINLLRCVSTYSASQFNLLINNWLAEIGLDNFEQLYITREFCSFADNFQENVLEGIEAFPFAPENRPRDYQHFQLADGMNFRKADGTMATVVVKPEMFIFHVWK